MIGSEEPDTDRLIRRAADGDLEAMDNLLARAEAAAGTIQALLPPPNTGGGA